MVTDSRWSLSSAAFERLLAVLADDREAGAAAYAALRLRIAGLMRWWGAPDPEALADQTLDRVAIKLDEGAPVTRDRVGAFARGVARLIFLEARRAPAHVADFPVLEAPLAEPPSPAPLDCLDHCLDQLSADDRALVLRYYDAVNQIAQRRALAAEYAVSAGALRLRTHRIRARLEACVTSCLRRP